MRCGCEMEMVDERRELADVFGSVAGHLEWVVEGDFR